MMNLRKLGRSYTHNCLIHQLCFLADLLEELGITRFSKKIDDLHDRTAPTD